MTSLTTLPYESISRRFKDQVDQARDYTIIAHDNIFRSGLCSTPVFDSSFENLAGYLNGLMTACEGLLFEEIFHGDIIETEEGPAYDIVTRVPLCHPAFPREVSLDKILSRLTLVRGIGSSTERSLKRKGCRSVRDLIHNRRYQGQAEKIVRVADQGEPLDICRLISGWFPQAHPLSMIGASLHDPGRMVFLDLETLGFFSRPIIILGIGVFHEEALEVHQIVLRDIMEEPAALAIAGSFLQEDTVLVSYNGRAFDLPYLRERSAYYGMPFQSPAVHYDLLHVARRLYGGLVPDCRLGSLEKHLFLIERENDVPGFMVPECYGRYMDSGNAGVLIPVIAHNRQDIVSLALLMARAIGDAHECC